MTTTVETLATAIGTAVTAWMITTGEGANNSRDAKKLQNAKKDRNTSSKSVVFSSRDSSNCRNSSHSNDPFKEEITANMQ